MLQLFDNQAIGSVGKPAVVRSALWSLIIHGSVFLFLVSLALSPAVQSLPDHFNLVHLVAPLPPAPPLPPLPPARAVNVPARQVTRVFTAKLTAPVSIPNYIPALDTVLEAPPEMAVVGGVSGGILGGVPSGVPSGLVGGIPAIGLPPPPSHEPKKLTPPEPPTPQRVQVSADIQEAKLVKMIRPEYPKVALMARINGTVRLKAIIDAKGRLTELKVVEGHPLLAAAAREAVEKWRYHPTFLNGEAVEVATDIIVNFRLI
jgi:TonB family protein